MTAPAPDLFAVELRPHTPAEWIATYYPLIKTTAGSRVDITTVLHQHRLPGPPPNHETARWLEARAADPDAPCYAGYPTWKTELAAGYAASVTAYHTENTQPPSRHLTSRAALGTAVILPGQLPEWLINDTVSTEDENT